MASLGTILVDGAAVNVTTVWTVGTYLSIDEGISSADGLEVGHDANDSGTNNYLAYYRLADVPSDFGSMDTINYNIMYRVTGAQTNTRSLFIQIVTDASTPVALTSEATVATGITNTTSNTTGAIAMTISGTPTKTQWNNALVRLRLNSVRNKGGDSNGIRVDTVQFTGTYTVTSGLALSFNGVAFSSIDNMNGVLAASIGNINGVS